MLYKLLYSLLMIELSRQFTTKLSSRLSEPLNFLQVVVGPRQVGKTTGLKQLYDRWTGPKVMASADLPAPPEPEWILRYWNEAMDAADEPVLLVLDEVQKVSRWSETIKGLYDPIRSQRRLRVVLLGSASLALSAGLSETLAGRFERIYVPHWDYNESAEAFGWGLDEYLRYGGYPAPAELLPDVERWQSFLRDSIIEPVVARDIFGLASIRKPALFRQTLELAMQYPGQEVSYQKLVGQLQDAGNVSTIRHYLEILQQAFLIRLLPQFSGGVIRQKASSPKIVPLCPALVHAFVSPERMDRDQSWKGRIIELVVGAKLSLRHKSLYYWRKRNLEVDYVIAENGEITAVEVKSGRERKRTGVNAFLKEYPQAKVKVVDASNLKEFLAEG